MKRLVWVVLVACGGQADRPPPVSRRAPVAADANNVTADAAPVDALIIDAPAPPAVRPAGKPKTGAEAIAALRKQWDATALPQITSHPPFSWVNPTELSARIHGKDVQASKVPCREWHDRIVDTIGPGSNANVLFGTLSALARDGTCWMIDARDGRFTDVWSYLDSETGELLLIWHTIEG